MEAVAEPRITVIDHPLIQVRLTRLRDETRPSREFRERLHEIAQLMVFEVTRGIETRAVTVRTPIADATGRDTVRPIILVPILRAGLGMLNGILSILPEAQIGHIGMFRNEETHRPQIYYRNLPSNIGEADVLLIDHRICSRGAAGQSSVIDAG